MYHQDANSLDIHLDHYEKLKGAGYVGKSLGPGRSNYGDGGVFHVLFLAPKMKLLVLYTPLSSAQYSFSWLSTSIILDKIIWMERFDSLILSSKWFVESIMYINFNEYSNVHYHFWRINGVMKI